MLRLAKLLSTFIIFQIATSKASADQLALPLPNTQAAGQHPIAPRESLAKITVPDRFKVTLFAGEPDISQPISMTIDARGRLWVAQCFSSPDWNDGKTGSDRILIFEDTNHDGQFEKRKVFADHLPNLTSVQLGYGGVWACCAPNLIFIPDANRDDQPDGPAQVKLDGWITPDHNLFNGLKWGPDGWLYGCHGILGTSKVGKPGTPDSERQKINCGIWRYHPKTEMFEVVCHGTTNPWGLDWDEHGQAIFTNCVIGHLWHMVPGAYYKRMFGVHFNPYVYDVIDTCADHVHWKGGDWTSSRFGVQHADAGGGHAHSGAMIYLGDNWPDEYRGNLFLSNIHGNRINRDRLKRSGSGMVGTHAPDFLMANDPWFRALELVYGPDGGVFISDWTDFGECHDNDGVHRSSGRIYKVVYDKPNDVEADLDLYKKSNAALVGLLNHKNAWYGRWARRILQERAAQGLNLEPKLIQRLQATAEDRKSPVTDRLRALWTLYVTEKLQDKTIVALLTDANEYIRSWAVQLAVDIPLTSRMVIEQIKRSAMSPISDLDKLYFASALGRMPKNERMNMAFALLGLDYQATTDRNLQLMVWYSLEPIVLDDQQRSLKLASRIQMPLVREFMTRRLLTDDPKLVNDVIQSATRSSAAGCQAGMLRGILAVDFDKGVQITKDSKRRLFAFNKSNQPELRHLAQLVSVRLGFDSMRRELWKSVANSELPRQVRVDSLLELGKTKNVSDIKRYVELLSDQALADAALAILKTFNRPESATGILAHFETLNQRQRYLAVDVLTARPNWAVKLFQSIASGTISADYVRPLALQRLKGMKRPEIDQQVAKYWPLARAVSRDKKSQIKKYKSILGDDVLGVGDVGSGKKVFARVCGQCHKMYGKGGVIGPDLTGSGRHDLEYILQNVVDPSAVVAKNYRSSSIETEDGLVLTGIVVRRLDDAIQLQTAEKIETIKKVDIADETPSTKSIMPDGLFDQLDEKQLRDLVAFLMSE